MKTNYKHEQLKLKSSKASKCSHILSYRTGVKFDDATVPAIIPNIVGDADVEGPVAREVTLLCTNLPSVVGGWGAGEDGNVVVACILLLVAVEQ